MFELGCALELFALPRPELNDYYHCEVITFHQQPMNMLGGIVLQTPIVKDLRRFDFLIVPSWPVDDIPVESCIRQEICHFYQSNKRIISFCSGAFLLASLGFFNHRKATTHWQYAKAFKTKFPDVDYVEDILYCFDGTIGCSAGSAAAIDLGLEVIRYDLGHQVANQIARRLVLSAHRKGGQSQFVESPMPRKTSQFSQALDWAIQNLSAPIDIDTFAYKAKMSRRTFDRKFRNDFNLSPKAWLIVQRIEKVKSLLESSQHSIDEIAYSVGFEHAATLRHHFRKIVGISPSVYRQNFNGKIHSR
ncbi:MAG: helix-turn-helix domain-containing protein [Pseudomonadota bacterium]